MDSEHFCYDDNSRFSFRNGRRGMPTPIIGLTQQERNRATHYPIDHNEPRETRRTAAR
jgi:hypothetical protein